MQFLLKLNIFCNQMCQFEAFFLQLLFSPFMYPPVRPSNIIALYCVSRRVRCNSSALLSHEHGQKYIGQVARILTYKVSFPLAFNGFQGLDHPLKATRWLRSCVLRNLTDTYETYCSPKLAEIYRDLVPICTVAPPVSPPVICYRQVAEEIKAHQATEEASGRALMHASES